MIIIDNYATSFLYNVFFIIISLFILKQINNGIPIINFYDDKLD